MRLDNSRDYRHITLTEKETYERILAQEETGRKFGKINHYNDFPEAVKHYLSLFPNNHIYLNDMKAKCDLHSINGAFYSLIHCPETNEQDVLRFINHEPQAFHIIGSIFIACGFHVGRDDPISMVDGFNVGHHGAYLFPEFCLGEDYRADYLLIGKGSGGFEFIFVELEKPNGYVTLKNGHLGQVIRSGENQIEDWKLWIDANFATLQDFFNSEKQIGATLPTEFCHYDSTRMHYVVVGGKREDYNDTTYSIRRRKEHETGIVMLHYDNLFDASESLLERNTF